MSLANAYSAVSFPKAPPLSTDAEDVTGGCRRFRSAAIVDLSFEVPGSGCPILVVRYPKAISSVPTIPGLHPVSSNTYL